VINGTQLTTTAGLTTTDVRFGLMPRGPPWLSIVLTHAGRPLPLLALQYLYNLTIVNNPQLTSLDGFASLLVVGNVQIQNNSADLSLSTAAVFALATNARAVAHAITRPSSCFLETQRAWRP